MNKILYILLFLNIFTFSSNHKESTQGQLIEKESRQEKKFKFTKKHYIFACIGFFALLGISFLTYKWKSAEELKIAEKCLDKFESIELTDVDKLDSPNFTDYHEKTAQEGKEIGVLIDTLYTECSVDNYNTHSTYTIKTATSVFDIVYSELPMVLSHSENEKLCRPIIDDMIKEGKSIYDINQTLSNGTTIPFFVEYKNKLYKIEDLKTNKAVTQCLLPFFKQIRFDNKGLSRYIFTLITQCLLSLVIIFLIQIDF